MSYPGDDNQRAMLVEINRRLKESKARGDQALNLGYTQVLNMAAELGIHQDEAEDIAWSLCQDKYFRGRLTDPFTRRDGTKAPFAVLKVVELTEKGRREIGE